MVDTYLNIAPPDGTFEGDFLWLYGNSVLSTDGDIAYVAGETFEDDHSNVRSGIFAVDVATGEVLQLWETDRSYSSVQDISPDGRYLLVNQGQFGPTLVLDLETGQKAFAQDSSIDGSTFYSDMIVLGNGTALLFPSDEAYVRAPQVVDLATGATSLYETEFRGGSTVTASADRSLLLVSSLGTDLTLIRVGQGVIATGSGTNNGIHAIAPTGDFIVNGSDLSVYDSQLNRLFSLQDNIASLDDVVGAAFSADGSKLYVLNGERDSIEILDTSDWSLIASVPAGTSVKNGDQYYFLIPDDLLQASADGQYLTVRSDEGVIRVDLNMAAPGVGSGGDDILIGGAGVDALYGLAGADHLDGGAGADRMAGGKGNDTYVVDNAGDSVIEKANEGFDTVNTSISYTLTDNAESLRLIGVTGAVDAHGNAGNNWLNAVWVDVAPAAGTQIRLFGEGGNDNLAGSRYGDVLDGGTGVDTMAGGAGDDTYVVDNAGDIVIEQAGQGFDTVNSSSSYTLADNVESLRFLGVTGAVTGIGNAGNNWLNAVWIDVAPAAGTGNRLYGEAGDDHLYGSRYVDYLDGGTGADVMVGGAGSDTYWVNNVGDVVTEKAREGYDTVNTSISYTLTANVEALKVSRGGVDAHGNALDNLLNALNATNNGSEIRLYGEGGNDQLYGSNFVDYLDGGTGADVMVGVAGSDTYVVDNVGDIVSERAGNGYDTVITNISYTLTANVEALKLLNLTAGVDAHGNGDGNLLNALFVDQPLAAGTQIRLYGEGGNDQLYGSKFADYLDGGTGADVMVGGAGSDTYVVEHGSDVVSERAGNGYDTVITNISYTLTANVEALKLMYLTAGVDAHGNAQDNMLNALWVDQPLAAGTQIRLFGEGGNDELYGSRYADYLDGGAGKDSLTGGAGNDRFHFGDALNALTNVDSILDFQHGDVIELDDAIFKGLSSGALGAGAFAANASGAATTADQRIVYDTDSGQLFYDADGSGAGGAVLFATVANHPALSAADFVVV